MKFYRFWFVRQSRISFDIKTLLSFAFFVGIVRGLLELIFFGVPTSGSDILAYVPFYLSLPFIYSGLLSVIPGITYKSALQPVTFATLLGVLPPVVDFIFRSHDTHRVFYGYFVIHDTAQFPWLGYNPGQNYPFGESVTIWLTFFFVSAFVYSRTRSVVLSLFGAALGYAAFLIYSLVIPWSLSYVIAGYVPNRSVLEQMGTGLLRQMLYLISATQLGIAWLIDSLVTRSAKYYLKRTMHFLPFLMLTILGCVQSRADIKSGILACAITLASGITVTAHNDLRGQNFRGAKHMVNTANIFAVTLYIMVLFSGYRFALLGLACFCLSLLYHYPFFNARGTMLGSMKVEGFWGFLTYMTGATAGYAHHPDAKLILTGGLAFGGFALFSLLKDAKDLREDFHEKRETIYTRIFRSGHSIRGVQRIFALIFAGGLLPLGFLFSESKPIMIIHTLLALFSSYAVLKTHKRFWFQLFLGGICIILTNAIVFEVTGQKF